METLDVWWIIAVAAIIRVVFLILFCATTDWGNYAPLSGATAQTTGVDGYIQIARTLWLSGEYALEPGGMPVPFRPPVQPFLMLIFGSWSPSHWHVIWLVCSVALGVATIWVLWKCTQLVRLPALSARLLLLAAAFHPYLVFALRVPGIPSVLIFMTTLVLFAILSFAKSNGRNPFPCGVIWGVASLAHGCFLPLLMPMSALLLLAIRGTWKQKLGRTCLMAATALVVVSPWTLRNQLAFGRLIPVSTGGALQYWIADQIYFHRDYRKPPPPGGFFQEISDKFERNHGRKPAMIHGGILDLNDDDLLVKEAKEQIRSQPSILLDRAFKGSLLFWTTMDKGLKKAVIVALMNLPLILLGLTLFMVVVARRSWTTEYLLAVFFMLGFWALFALVQAIGPYFVAISPCLLFVIALGFQLAGRQRQGCIQTTGTPDSDV